MALYSFTKAYSHQLPYLVIATILWRWQDYHPYFINVTLGTKVDMQYNQHIRAKAFRKLLENGAKYMYSIHYGKVT